MDTSVIKAWIEEGSAILVVILGILTAILSVYNAFLKARAEAIKLLRAGVSIGVIFCLFAVIAILVLSKPPSKSFPAPPPNGPDLPQPPPPLPPLPDNPPDYPPDWSYWPHGPPLPLPPPPACGTTKRPARTLW